MQIYINKNMESTCDNKLFNFFYLRLEIINLYFNYDINYNFSIINSIFF